MYEGILDDDFFNQNKAKQSSSSLNTTGTEQSAAISIESAQSQPGVLSWYGPPKKSEEEDDHAESNTLNTVGSEDQSILSNYENVNEDGASILSSLTTLKDNVTAVNDNDQHDQQSPITQDQAENSINHHSSLVINSNDINGLVISSSGGLDQPVKMDATVTSAATRSSISSKPELGYTLTSLINEREEENEDEEFVVHQAGTRSLKDVFLKNASRSQNTPHQHVDTDDLIDAFEKEIKEPESLQADNTSEESVTSDHNEELEDEKGQEQEDIHTQQEQFKGTYKILSSASNDADEVEGLEEGNDKEEEGEEGPHENDNQKPLSHDSEKTLLQLPASSSNTMGNILASAKSKKGNSVKVQVQSKYLQPRQTPILNFSKPSSPVPSKSVTKSPTSYSSATRPYLYRNDHPQEQELDKQKQFLASPSTTEAMTLDQLLGISTATTKKVPESDDSEDELDGDDLVDESVDGGSAFGMNSSSQQLAAAISSNASLINVIEQNCEQGDEDEDNQKIGALFNVLELAQPEQLLIRVEASIAGIEATTSTTAPLFDKPSTRLWHLQITRLALTRIVFGFISWESFEVTAILSQFYLARNLFEQVEFHAGQAISMMKSLQTSPERNNTIANMYIAMARCSIEKKRWGLMSIKNHEELNTLTYILFHPHPPYLLAQMLQRNG